MLIWGLFIVRDCVLTLPNINNIEKLKGSYGFDGVRPLRDTYKLRKQNYKTSDLDDLEERLKECPVSCGFCRLERLNIIENLLLHLLCVFLCFIIWLMNVCCIISVYIPYW